MEFKANNNKLTKEQKLLKSELEKNGYRYCVSHNFYEAMDEFRDYVVLGY